MSLHIKIEKFLTKKNISLIHLETVGSTMQDIKKYIGDKNICMIADQQTSGIGRRGNKWISPKEIFIYLFYLILIYQLKIIFCLLPQQQILFVNF